MGCCVAGLRARLRLGWPKREGRGGRKGGGLGQRLDRPIVGKEGGGTGAGRGERGLGRGLGQAGPIREGVHRTCFIIF